MVRLQAFLIFLAVTSATLLVGNALYSAFSHRPASVSAYPVLPLQAGSGRALKGSLSYPCSNRKRFIILALLKRVVENSIHDTVEEWVVKTSLPRQAVEEMRARRLALAVSVAQTTAQEGCSTSGTDDSALVAWVHRQ